MIHCLNKVLPSMGQVELKGYSKENLNVSPNNVRKFSKGENYFCVGDHDRPSLNIIKIIKMFHKLDQ